MTVTLASASHIRSLLLSQAGVPHDIITSKIDEETIKASLQAENGTPLDIVDALAEMKAQKVAHRVGGFVIGADQVLECGGTLYSKADDKDGAIAKLKALRGKPHTLLSAAVIYEDGKPVWRKTGRAQLFMRDFSDAFLESYLSKDLDKKLRSVGCYLLEEDGPQLFTRIQGDYFTVLGFPLLDVLDYLRQREVIPS